MNLTETIIESFEKGELTRSEVIQLYTNTMIELHTRALIAFCHCLAFNAENCRAAMLNAPIPYPDEAYFSEIKKWGLDNLIPKNDEKEDKNE